jgi:aspartate-semialdehyde dehydrogenase
VQYAFNLFSHNAPITENGYNEEEMKMVKETRKIWVSQTPGNRVVLKQLANGVQPLAHHVLLQLVGKSGHL